MAWLDRTDAEVDNLRSALAWFADHNGTASGLRLAGALVVYWRVRGAFSEGVQWLDRFLAEPRRRRRAVAPEIRAKALWGWGFLSGMLGRAAAAAPAVEEAVTLFEAAGDTRGQARALLILGNCHVFGDAKAAVDYLQRSAQLAEAAGDSWCLSHSLALAGLGQMRLAQMGPARASLEQSVSVARRAGEPQGLRFGLALLGDLASQVGDYAFAQVTLEESLALVRPLGDVYGTALALVVLGRAAVERGALEEARELLSEGRDLARRSTNPALLVAALCGLAWLALTEEHLEEAELLFREAEAEQPQPGVEVVMGFADIAVAKGDLDAAGSRYRTALRSSRRVGERRGEAAALHGLGQVAAARGAYTRAVTYQRQAVLASAEADDRPGIARALAALASLAMAAGRSRQAARLFGAASAVRDSTGAALPPRQARLQQPDIDRASEDLGPEAFAEAREEGAALSVESAVGYATRGGARRRGSGSGWNALTPSQREIAMLVAQGLTNRQIGKRLLVSAPTVASHLRHIFAKLDISSRTELAALAGRHQGQD